MTETDPNGVPQHAPGSKLDAGKIPVMRGLIRQFPSACEAVAQLSAFGAEKYTWDGWRTVADGEKRYADARARHEIALGKGYEIDDDTGLLHLTAVAWNAMAELELCLARREYEQLEDWVMEEYADKLAALHG